MNYVAVDAVLRDIARVQDNFPIKLIAMTPPCYLLSKGASKFNLFSKDYFINHADIALLLLLTIGHKYEKLLPTIFNSLSI